MREKVLIPSGNCEICSAPRSDFRDFNQRLHALCPSCHSAERQRVFSNLYETYIKDEYSLSGASVLLVGPGVAERRILARFGANVTTLDVRPEMPVDIYADVCSMKTVPDNTYDAVMASGVLSAVYDMAAALGEMHRVLRPGGCIFITDPNMRFDGPTTEIADEQEIVKWYGVDALSKYRVGFFRILGHMDVLAELEHRFVVKTYYGRDNANCEKVLWFMGVKESSVGAVSETCSILNEGNAIDVSFASLVRQVVEPIFITTAKPVHLLSHTSLSSAQKKTVERFATLLPSVLPSWRSLVDVDQTRNAAALSMYAEESVDLFVSFDTLDFIADIEGTIRNVARILRQGGCATLRLKEDRVGTGDEPPTIAYQMETQALGLGLTTKLPSMRVGRTWLLDAMNKVGLECKCFEYPVVGAGTILWFVGVKRAANRGVADTGVQKTSADSTSGKTEVSYTIPLPADTGYSSIRISLSLPNVPKALSNLDFAEHVMDVEKGVATQTVILCGTGGIGVSDDLGETWKSIRTTGFEDYRWSNCFTTSTGRHIVQSQGFLGATDPITDPAKHAALLIFDRNWQLVGQAKTRDGYWHGSASVGESDGVIMFAEYYRNLELYSPDFEQRKADYLQILRSNAIWRSRDDGTTWEKCLEFGPLQIRHFHTVIPDRFMPGVWWASSGDHTEETRVWRTTDQGDSWVDVTNREPSIQLQASYMPLRARCQRYTDAAVEREQIVWGADDYLGSVRATGNARPATERAGSRIFASPKSSPLQPREVAYIGHPVRSLVDVGPGWIVMTEAKESAIGFKPSVFLLFKQSFKLVKLMDLENYSNVGTGFTYSRSSRSAYKGIFFSFRNSLDVFKGGVRCLKWKVEFE